MRTHYCGELNSEHIGDTVTVCGWVHRRRDHGGVIFLDLRDRQGLLQVVVDPDTKQAFATADRARSEWVMQVTGLVRIRPEGTVNADMSMSVAHSCVCMCSSIIQTLFERYLKYWCDRLHVCPGGRPLYRSP